MRFAFEAEPRKCFERIGRQMPFGAHRWQKFDREFYEPYLLCERSRSAAALRSWDAGGHRDVDLDASPTLQETEL
jgi:hypothetical protein